MSEFAYKPEYDYKDTNYKPLGKSFTNDMCGSCKAYYKDLFQKGLTRSEFPIQCSGHVMDQVNSIQREDFVSDDEFLEAKIVLDPVSWAKQEFNWDHRWYQEFVSSCLNASALVFMDDGTVKSIKDVSVGEKVVTYDYKGTRVFSNKILQKFDQGVKPVYKITLENGDAISCTEDHKILSHVRTGETNLFFNWGSLKTEYTSIKDGLKVGDRVYCLNTFDKFGNVDNPALAKWLGYIASDSYVTDGKVQFANTRRIYIDEYIALMKELFPNDKVTLKLKKTFIDELGVTRKDSWTCTTYGRKSDSIKFLNSIGVIDKHTREIESFRFAFKFTKNSLSYFLNRLWSGDGCISTCDSRSIQHTRLSLHGGNKEPLILMRLLLKKAGVLSSHINKKENSKSVGIFISTISDVNRFLEFTGPIFGKEEFCSKAQTTLSGRRENRRRFGRSSRVLIKSIELQGHERVYDIEVASRHNFIANGVIVHNCTANKKVLRGGRRCLAKDTLIKTTRGDVFIQDIVVGDYVYSEYNKPVQVTRTFDQGLQEVVDIGNVVDGKLATCTLDHRWLGKSSKDTADDSKWYTEPSIIETRDLYEEDYKAVGHIEYVEDNYKLGHVSYIENKRLEQCYDIEVDSPTSLYCLANGLVTHNSGKSRVEIILVLHEMMTLANRRILLLCPSEKLIGEFFEVIGEFIKNSTNLRNSIDRSTKNPHMFKLKNGSKLLGISISPKDPDAGDKARGFDAHLFVIDESEMFKEKDMEAIMALLVSNPETRVMVSSTPKGWRKTFYRTCVNKNLGYKEFWWISAEKPDWSTETEAALREEFTEAAYTHEFNADFGELEEGVFKKKHIDKSLFKYETDSVGPSNDRKYILGVDWNKSAGNHMVIVEADGRHLKFIKKIITPESEFMQTTSVQNVIDLHAMWKFKYIFVDAGYGHVSCELLKKYGVENPGTRLAEIVHPIAMNQSIKIKSPVNGEEITKFSKQYIVDQTVKLLEDGCLVLPVSEDYGSRGESKHDVGLIEQMRNYRVENYSVYNLPRYSQGADHTLTAYMLACGFWVFKEGPLRTLPYSHRILSLPTATTTKVDLTPTQIERVEDMKKYKLITATGKVGLPAKPVNVRDLDTLMRRTNPGAKRPGSGRSSFGRPKGIGRTTF